jgi:hypothetical protein
MSTESDEALTIVEHRLDSPPIGTFRSLRLAEPDRGQLDAEHMTRERRLDDVGPVQTVDAVCPERAGLSLKDPLGRVGGGGRDARFKVALLEEGVLELGDEERDVLEFHALASG